MPHNDDILREYDAARKQIAHYDTVEEWSRFVSLDHFTEFNVIFPVLLSGRDVIAGIKGARFTEPSVRDGSYFDSPHVSIDDREVRVFGDSILITTTGQTARPAKDGTIAYETTKLTQIVARIDGKLMLVHSHSGPPGNQSPPYHEKDRFGG
jgi:hypothetical protein